MVSFFSRSLSALLSTSLLLSSVFTEIESAKAAAPHKKLECILPYADPAANFPSAGLTGTYSAPLLDYTFDTGVALPSTITFSRASKAWGFVGTAPAVLTEYANNTPRLSGQGILLEPASTNFTKNPRGEGAIPGTPGTLPTGWQWTNTAGLTQSVVGTGTENGIPYTDIRVSGTFVSGALVFAIGAITDAAFAPGDHAVAATYFKLAAGSWTNVTNINQLAYAYNSSSATLSNVLMTPGIIVASTITNAALSSQRFGGAQNNPALTFPAATAYGRIVISFTITTGPIDFTLRIGAPQLENNGTAYGTSPILPPVGTPSVTARVAEQLYSNGTNFTSFYDSNHFFTLAADWYLPSNHLFTSPTNATVIAGFDNENTPVGNFNSTYMRYSAQNNAPGISITNGSLGGLTGLAPLGPGGNIWFPLGTFMHTTYTSGKGGFLRGATNGVVYTNTVGNGGEPPPGGYTRLLMAELAPFTYNTPHYLRRIRYWNYQLDDTALAWITSPYYY